MQLIAAADYYQELTRQLRSAHRRITLAAMLVAEGERMHEVFAACEAAARRGVTVRVVFDIYTLHWLARTKKMARWQVTQAGFERLERAGVEVRRYGRIGLNPVAGRQHAKVSIIDDVVYAGGGVNLTDLSFELTDYMLRWRDRAAADQLDALVAGITLQGAQADVTTPLTATSELLFDGGAPGESVIYDRACQLTEQARHLWYVSQYGPSGRLAPLVRAAQTDCYFNRVWQASPPGNLLLVRDKLVYGVKNRYTRPNYIHAKFILFELKDGTKAVLSGSNNFSWDGVRYGTKELALYSTDEKLWQQLYDYLQQTIS
jgi:cardiolipin synthase